MKCKEKMLMTTVFFFIFLKIKIRDQIIKLFNMYNFLIHLGLKNAISHIDDIIFAAKLKSSLFFFAYFFEKPFKIIAR